MTETTTVTSAPRLKARYAAEIKGQLQEQFGHANVMQVPGVVKVVFNMGVGDAADRRARPRVRRVRRGLP